MMKYIFYASILSFAIFCIYVAVVTRNSRQMTIKQKVLKAIYPVYAWVVKKTSNKSTMTSNSNTVPIVSFYTLKSTLNNGQPFNFDRLKGKKVLLVNTASDCGYTGQYTGLEKISEQYNDKLVVIGFPSNDFGEQEKANDETIAAFCNINYGVTFPLMKKTVVIKENGQHEVYRWLTEKSQNGWNDKQPSWNFCKYIVDEEGKLTHYFPATVEPTDKEIIAVIK
jgi:glutathione peroxidase